MSSGISMGTKHLTELAPYALKADTSAFWMEEQERVRLAFGSYERLLDLKRNTIQMM